MKKSKKLTSLLLTTVMASSLLAACGNNKTIEPTSTGKAAESTPVVTSVPEQTPVTLKFWTWFPSVDAFKPIIDKFQSTHPNIKVDLTVMESKDFQTKLPLSLATDEKLDVVGVQTGAMPKQIEKDLLNLEDLLKADAPDWESKFSEGSSKQVRSQADGVRFLSMGSVGSMVMFYNKDLLDKLGFAAPKTYDELKKIAKAVNDKNDGVLPVAFDSKDAWAMEEVLWTLIGQNSDLYNKWRYNQGGKLNDPAYVQGLNDMKSMFDDGVLTKSTLDLDYSRSREVFTSGKAVFFVQGTWEANLLSNQYRTNNKIAISDLGMIGIPTVRGGTASIRSFIDLGLGIPQSSKHPKEALEFIKFMTTGEGNDMLANQFALVPNRTFKPDSALLTTDTAKQSYSTLISLIGKPSADRNNNSPFSDYAGQQIQKLIVNKTTAEKIANDIQKEFETGKYPN